MLSCQTDDGPVIPQTSYSISGNQIQYQGNDITLNGVNALHTFGLEQLDLMDTWNVKIVREFIGNLREQPISGGAIQDANNKWLHSLEQIVQENRKHGIATILCPFGWVDDNGNQTLFTGLNPSEQSFYSAYKAKMQEIATFFSGQEDVWIEVWNEPYHWNNENNYSHSLWLSDMRDMVGNLRSVSGFESIILIPGNEQGQSEESLVVSGQELLSDNYNLLFDLHAYEKWLNNASQADILERVERLKNTGFPLLFGEIGVRNVGDLMDPQPFLNALTQAEVSTLAWLWKREAADQSALLNEAGSPNNLNNNNWGSSFQEFLSN